MKPKFKDTLAWEQAQLLMQPIFIRLLDNLRKYLDASSWTGKYQETQEPYPKYELLLTYQDKCVTLDIWELCYQICFTNFNSKVIESQKNISQNNGTKVDEIQEVEIDISLIDEEGEVDWKKIEDKTSNLVKNIFKSLS